MLRPSKYEARTGLWVWTPSYEEGDEEEGDADNEADPDGDPASSGNQDAEEDNRYEMEIGAEIRFKVKSINFTQITDTAKGMQATTTTTAQAQAAIHPNQMGGQGSISSNDTPNAGDDTPKPQPVRKRSVSVDLTESQNMPATMHVVASICEDGLGLTSWWTSQEDEQEEEENNGDEEGN